MQTIVNLGTGGADLNGQNGSTTSADSNDALFLDWPGDNGGNYVYLPGVAGNNLSVPDEAALDITGDIDIRVHVAMDDWTPAGTNDLCGKLTTSGDQRSWYFRLLTTGDLQLAWSTDGTFGTLGAVNSTASVTAVDGDALWLRVTLDVDNGSSQHEVKFYTSDDGSSWTQLGSTRVISGTTSIFSSTSPFRLGARGDIGGIAPGKFYRAQVLNGIDGTPVLDVDCSQITSGSATTFAALTGQTVTINRSTSGRKSVAVVSPVWLFGTDDRFVVTNNALINISATDNFSVLLAIRQWNTAINNGRYIGKQLVTPGWRVNANGTTVNANNFLTDGATANAESVSNNTSGSLNITGFRIDRTAQQFVAYANGSFSAGDDLTSIGGFVNTTNLGIGAEHQGSAAQDFELVAVAFFRRALSDAEFAQLRSYYQARLS